MVKRKVAIETGCMFVVNDDGLASLSFKIDNLPEPIVEAMIIAMREPFEKIVDEVLKSTKGLTHISTETLDTVKYFDADNNEIKPN